MASARVCLLTRLLFIVFGIAPGLLHTAHFPLADAFAAVDKRTEAVGGQVKKKRVRASQLLCTSCEAEKRIFRLPPTWNRPQTPADKTLDGTSLRSDT